jgi:hypothetical protein
LQHHQPNNINRQHQHPEQVSSKPTHSPYDATTLNKPTVHPSQITLTNPRGNLPFLLTCAIDLLSASDDYRPESRGPTCRGGRAGDGDGGKGWGVGGQGGCWAARYIYSGLAQSSGRQGRSFEYSKEWLGNHGAENEEKKFISCDSNPEGRS